MNPQSQSSSAKNNKLLAAILLTAVAVIALFFFRENSTAKITVVPSGHSGQVFVNKQKTARISAKATTTFRISPGSKEVLISGDNTYPWKDRISVSAGSTTTITPFLVPQRPRTLTSIPKKISQKLEKVTINPPTSVVTNDDKKEVVVTEDGRLGARWQAGSSTAPSYFSCSDNSCKAIIYDNNNQPAQQVGMYPGRSDAVIFATNTGVYALEIDPSGDTQNFQPITQDAQNPHFITADNTVFVKSRNEVTAINL